MSTPEKCPKCGMKFYRTVQDRGSHLDENDQFVSYSFDVDEFDCSSRGTRDGGFFSQSGICLMRERDALRARVAELEAALAASVPREVAERTAHIFGVAMMVIATGVEKHPNPIEIAEEIVAECVRVLHEAPPDDQAQKFLRLALARAEAEARAAGEEPDNG